MPEAEDRLVYQQLQYLTTAVQHFVERMAVLEREVQELKRQWIQLEAHGIIEPWSQTLQDDGSPRKMRRR